ncbi:hypothetical protein FHETE_6956 [Fusarium heterosporum]|uniref:F-box domain-containing protein n=1 Tax=Fusarium heterosporum TaxID=42747 RepID=A0A8H5WN24_FUSHE|nr:hypothetical protein FHETE_6956 [Fusarium heterosporum]
MELINLPREILAEIFSLDDPILPKQDILSARLTCRELAEVLTPILFYSIRISPLVQDSDEFFSIIRQPHLACLVKVVVWEELNGDLSELDLTSWRDRIPVSEHPFFNDLTANARSLFWLKGSLPEDPYQQSGRLKPAYIHHLRERFQDAVLNNIPNLTTLVSRPMNPRRQLKLLSMDYEIKVETITNFIQRSLDSRDFLNFGFHFFLIPTLKLIAQKHLAGNPSPKITKLLYSDEGISALTSLVRLREEDSTAFSMLQHLDFCIAGQSTDVAMIRLMGFFACLQNANNLTTLKICQELREARGYGTIGANLVDMLPTLPKLTEVHFVNINIAKSWDGHTPRPSSMESEFLDEYDLRLRNLRQSLSDGESDDESEKIPLLTPVGFLLRHTKTLRRVYIHGSDLSKRVVKQLAKLHSLQLERFVVTSRDHSEDLDDFEYDYDYKEYRDTGEANREPVDEQALLKYINRVDGNEHSPPLPYKLKQRATELRTHDAIYDNNAYVDTAISDTRGLNWRERGYEVSDVQLHDSQASERRGQHGMSYNIGLRRTRDADTGLWVDVDGCYYNPITDEEIEDSIGFNQSSDDSWATQGQRVWEPELGLWKHKETGALFKYAIDRELLTLPTIRGVDSIMGQDDIDMQPFYDQEEESHLLRIEGGPRWDWGLDEDSKVWYWQTTSNTGHATEMWRFEHNGEYAYGSDPLEFWDDWYNEPEDKVEATPFGWNLALFFTKPTATPGGIVQDINCKGLTKYDVSKDPMFQDRDWWRCMPAPVEIGIHSERDWYYEFGIAVELLETEVPGRGCYSSGFPTKHFPDIQNAVTYF